MTESERIVSDQTAIFDERWTMPSVGNAYEAELFLRTVRFTRHSLIEWSTALPDVLEIGAGDGSLAAAIDDRVGEYLGIDVSVVGIEAARARKLARCKFSVASLEAWHDSNEHRFDAILLFEVLEHLADGSLAARQLARMLKPGGILLSSTPNAARLTNKVKRLMRRKIVLIPSHVHEYTWAEAANLWRAAGFVCLDRQGAMLYGGRRLLGLRLFQRTNARLGELFPALAIRSFSAWRRFKAE